MLSLCYLMSNVYSFLTGIILLQPFSLNIFLTSIVFSAICIYLYDNCFKQLCVDSPCTNQYDFDYGLEKGPHKWKHLFPDAKGCYQSPVNIRTETTHILKISEPLTWTSYDEFPVNVRISNNGHTVVLRAEYENEPTLSGADLVETYSFVSLCFRWSLFDDEGSEHAVNDRRYPLEMQAVHLSKEDTEDCNSIDKGDLGVLILSYFFTTTKHDNPYLDSIIFYLEAIREPNTCTEIPPFPLSWLCYPYMSGFYSYGGSLTEPPCTEGVTWFVQPEPLSISENQLLEFRQILSKNGTRIVKNSRPVQELNSRIVCYNRFENLEDEMEEAETC